MPINAHDHWPSPPDRAGAVVGRYAPSPTGDLHLGNLATALRAWEDCRRRRGIFILRIEDIDAPRTVPGAEERMLDDLRWIGIDWDEGPDVGGPAAPYRQSERLAIYDEALRRLEAQGRTFLCTCSRRDLREASAPHGEPDAAELDGEGPVYPGTCRLSDPLEQRKHPAGAATRLRITDPENANAIIEFDDLLLGPQRFDLAALCGDFVIRRRDNLFAYQLACAVDDGLMGVSHVIRGADLLTSTPRQIAILRALNLPEPQYGHVPLVVDEAGRRMCKRDGSCSLRQLREQGLSPDDVREMLMKMPTSLQPLK